MPHSYGSSFTLSYFSRMKQAGEKQREQRKAGRDGDKDGDWYVG